MLIRATHRRLAEHVWLERRLFEIVGAWSADCPDPDVACTFAAQSMHHAWRAAQWDELRPVLHDVADVSLTSPLLDAVAPMAGTTERLAVLGRNVLPELLGRYGADLAGTNPVADGPVIRVLHRVLADGEEDRRATEALLSTLRSEDDEPRAETHRPPLVGLPLITDSFYWDPQKN